MISLIVAMAENRIIGVNNQLPWHLPNDLKWFKQNTLNKTILMGRKTFESIGKALPERRNLVLTRDENFSAAGCEVITSLEEITDFKTSQEELMVIGGSNLYQQLLPAASRVYLTKVLADVSGDTFFPEVDFSQWKITFSERCPQDNRHVYPYQFMILEH